MCGRNLGQIHGHTSLDIAKTVTLSLIFKGKTKDKPSYQSGTGKGPKKEVAAYIYPDAVSTRW